MTNDAGIPDSVARHLVDPVAYANDTIFDTYRWLRANNPFGLAELEGYTPFWVATRYEDVKEISRDRDLFPHGDRPSVLTEAASEQMFRQITGKPYLIRSLVQMDAPDHAKYRFLTQAFFMPKALKSFDDRIVHLAQRAVQRLLDKGPNCDFVKDVALHYPLEVIMGILGVPEEDFPFMLRLTQEVFAPADPDSIPQGVDRNDPAFFGRATMAVIGSLSTYFNAITEDRRRSPRNDVASVIANAEIDGQPISDLDTLGYYVIIATAGHDTTSSASAAAMLALATQPETLRRVKSDPTLIPALVEEAIRWASPVKTFMRSVAEDTEFAGRQLRRGDWIMLCYASANRDEAVIADADRFDIDRPKFAHLAFGYGVHLCLGQHLARKELIALFEAMLPRIQSVALAGEPELAHSYFVNGLKRLPLRITPEPVLEKPKARQGASPLEPHQRRSL